MVKTMVGVRQDNDPYSVLARCLEDGVFDLSGVTASFCRRGYSGSADSSDDVIYLVDVQRHKRQDQTFENTDLLRILEDNWPDVLKHFTLTGIGTAESGLPSGQEVREDRKASLTNIVTTPGGRLLSPMGGGITTAGTSARNRMAADRDQRSVKNLQEQFEQARPRLEKYFQEHHDLAWEEVDIRLTSFSPSMVVTERNTEKVLYPEQRAQ